jgi:hypothetical protein
VAVIAGEKEGFKVKEAQITSPVARKKRRFAYQKAAAVVKEA